MIDMYAGGKYKSGVVVGGLAVLIPICVSLICVGWLIIR